MYGGKNLDSLDLANHLVDIIEDKKGNDILLLDMREQSVLTDYFLLCSAGSNRQINALSESIRDEAKLSYGEVAMGSEGTADSGWVLIDFGDVIVHIFSEEQRAYYALEELWKESRVVLRMA